MMNNYNNIVDWYGKNRNQSIGIEAIDLFFKNIPRNSVILDAGCGNGFPIASHLSSLGYQVIGVDSSEKMILEFKKNIPNHQGILGNIQDIQLPCKLEAIIAWGVIFHLKVEEQKLALNNLVSHLKENGLLAFTSGFNGGAVTSSMNGELFTYYSMGKSAYVEYMKTINMKYVNDTIDQHDNWCIVFQK